MFELVTLKAFAAVIRLHSEGFMVGAAALSCCSEKCSGRFFMLHILCSTPMTAAKGWHKFLGPVLTNASHGDG